MARVENILDLPGPYPEELWPLICTTEIPIETINKFILASEECAKRMPNVKSQRINIWSLILTHSQSRADQPTSAPIPEGDTSTTFKNATLDDLGRFCRERFSVKEGETQPEPPIASDRFGVLDERSLRDDTMMLVRWEKWSEPIDPNWPDDDDAWRDLEGWANVRVSFRYAPKAVGGVSEDLQVSDMKYNLEERDDGVWLKDS